jgi:hypothetical protein
MDFLLSVEDTRGSWLGRLLLERGIAFICLLAFLNAWNQFRPLLGEHGLLPVRSFIQHVPFSETPSLFYWFSQDRAFLIAAAVGMLLTLLVLTGVASRTTVGATLTWLAIYLLYLSFVNVGQTFYAFGWESILLEACFFAMFLGGSRAEPQPVSLWLFRWLLFRIMFGAGLIKIRGDSCWRDLTCLDFHYETQPMPNPLSWYLHWSPHWMKAGGVLFNHFAELIVPFGLLLPQPIAGIAGLITIAFQLSIIVTGNLSWLNWLTLILAFSTLDTKFFGGMFSTLRPMMQAPARPVVFAYWGVALLVGMMSIPVIVNMLSARQMMNADFNSLHLVGTYGAFGRITRIRHEVVLEGTEDYTVTPTTVWHEYEFKAKPGDLGYRPPQIAPYHLRLDWLMWFAAMSDYQDNPWFVNLVSKLLQGDRAVLGLLRSSSFRARPPRYIRARLYEYHFTTPEQHRANGAWWTRSLSGEYFPAVSLNDGKFRNLLKTQGWLSE